VGEAEIMASKKKLTVRSGRRAPVQNGLRPKRKIIGMGRFDSGPPDLATNEKYMEDFGLSRSEILRRRAD
jgi:hypothetical protein